MKRGKGLADWSSGSKFGMQPIAKVLRNRRLTVSQLAIDAGIVYGRLLRLVHGASAPAPVETEKLVQVLGMAVSDLFTDEAREAGGEEL